MEMPSWIGHRAASWGIGIAFLKLVPQPTEDGAEIDDVWLDEFKSKLNDLDGAEVDFADWPPSTTSTNQLNGFYSLIELKAPDSRMCRRRVDQDLSHRSNRPSQRRRRRNRTSPSEQGKIPTNPKKNSASNCQNQFQPEMKWRNKSNKLK